ncbi:hypothetical protein [Liquorilactobacillus nagelii]|uniref:hypothetical protein n=1 Tax=Liquorilactobacillus nagelii TaxID=82688 RepID=UPI0006F0FED5|nr:hypothetical protein [Liquorilactobacillus nagelii]KRL40908.1 hypothetical protein FD45_GL001558 [Liquorilactobacillus nagelii DSM 13675]QYH55408.1 hypothetical protein G6O73_03770 [Liquorilactobacillus nagelii DSM 13675]
MRHYNFGHLEDSILKEESKFILILSRVATVLAVLMYISYIPQIMNNLQGDYGNPIQPLVAAINCSFWSIYAYFKINRDWPVFWANIPGVFFGLAAFITALH